MNNTKQICEVKHGEITTLLAILVGAFNFNKFCSNEAIAKIITAI